MRRCPSVPIVPVCCRPRCVAYMRLPTARLKPPPTRIDGPGTRAVASSSTSLACCTMRSAQHFMGASRMVTAARVAFCLILAFGIVGCDRSAPETRAASAGTASTTSAAQPALLPRTLLFGNPERASGQLSPDGRWLGYIAPRDGVMNVYVAPSSDPSAARPVTNDRVRGIRNFSFAYTNDHVLYEQDVGGDENYQVFVVDLTTDTEQALTPKGSRANVAHRSRNFPDEVIVSVNDRDPRYFDLVRVNLVSGAQTRILENDEFLSFVTDDDFRLRFAVKQTEDGGQEIFIRDGYGWRSWASVPQADALT